MRWMRTAPWLGLLFSIGATASGDDGRVSLPVGTAGPAIQPVSWINVPAKGFVAPELKGHVTLLEFFETFCGPCKRTMPHIQALHERYAARGLTVICISVEAPAALATFAADGGYTMPIACDSSKSITRAYRIQPFPTDVLVDKEGKVAHVGNPFSVDAPIEQALGIETDPGALLSKFVAATEKKDAAGAKVALDDLVDRARRDFDLKGWAAAQAAAEPAADAPSDAPPVEVPLVPTDPAKALVEWTSAGTPTPRREAIRAALAESGPTEFDLLAFARESLGRGYPLTPKEAKEWVAQARLDLLVDGLLDRRPSPAVLDEAIKMKPLVARAAKRAADARGDARKALILEAYVFKKELTVDQAKAARFWEEIVPESWAHLPSGQMVASDVRAYLLRPTTTSAFIDRRLAQAIVLESLAVLKKPALATLSADVTKARAAIIADLKSKYPQ